LRFHERMLRAHRKNFGEVIRRHQAGLAECERALGVTGGSPGEGSIADG
jgi:hypothetical protein